MEKCKIKIINKGVGFRILLYMYKNKRIIYRTDLAKKANTTITNSCILIEQMIKLGLVIEKKKEGKIKPLVLTKKGEEIAEVLFKLNTLI